MLRLVKIGQSAKWTIVDKASTFVVYYSHYKGLSTA